MKKKTEANDELRPQYDMKSLLKAHCSVHGSPAGWRTESALADFHELRQGFSPTNMQC